MDLSRDTSKHIMKDTQQMILTRKMIFGSLWARDLQLLALAYYVTDSERFASPKKKAKKVKIVRRSYPLEILLKSLKS